MTVPAPLAGESLDGTSCPPVNLTVKTLVMADLHLLRPGCAGAEAAAAAPRGQGPCRMGAARRPTPMRHGRPAGGGCRAVPFRRTPLPASRRSHPLAMPPVTGARAHI